MKQALKEWNAQIQALEAGNVSLIVRKGGIIERKNNFEVEHKQFWLYPTFLHQNPGELQAQYAPLLLENPRLGLVQFRVFAEVKAVWKIENLGLVKQLEPYQALSSAALERRFHYRDKPWVHALLLRVSRVSNPVTLPETPHYAGCVSWVELEQEIAVQGLEPVLEDSKFLELQTQLERLLG
jgi:hypothetical protein